MITYARYGGRHAAAGALEDDGVPEPESATGQYPDDIWAEPPAVAAALAEDDVPEAETATGQYPDEIWASTPPAAASLAADEEVPEPETATGQYPDDLWATPPASAGSLAADENVPEPETATGQYPDDVWAEPSPAAASALGDEDEPVHAPQKSSSAPPVTAELPPAPPPSPSPAPAPAPPAASAAPAPPAVPAAPAAEPADHLKEADYSDALPEMPEWLAPPLPPALTLQEMYRVVRAVAVPHSGEALYSAVSTDAEYPAGGRRFGVAFGLLLFTQASGRLGSVLALTERRNPELFERVLGAGARELLALANADYEEMRLAPVAGKALYDPGWIARLRELGGAEECRNAQNEEAIAHLFRPLLPWTLALGLDTGRGVAFVLDRAVTRGLGGGVRWAVEASGLLRDPAELNRALRHLGHRDLREFQLSTRWLAATGDPGPETTAALLARLRAAGGFALPAAAEVQARLLAAASGAARRRLERLSRSDALHDTPLGAS